MSNRVDLSRFFGSRFYGLEATLVCWRPTWRDAALLRRNALPREKPVRRRPAPVKAQR